MIGKQEWFKRRKYGGWGLTPKTWQGFAYMGVFMLIVFGIQFMPSLDENIKLIASGIVVLIVVIDVIHIMSKLKKDERERMHEAISERNALWVMIAILTIGIGYQVAAGMIKDAVEVDPFIIIALIGAVAAKSITNIYLDHKE